MPLTEIQIRKAKPTDKPVKLSDGKGLYLLLTPTGSKLWRWKYRVDGKEKLMTLGAYPDMPLAQVASVAVTDARSITITPWEKQMVGPVEKAILASDLGLTPNTAGTVIRLNIPALTEERRKDLAKVVHGEGEDAKVAIRNIRRDANHQVKELLKDKQITEDEASRTEAEIQKITDGAIKDVDEVIKGKEAELMSV